MTIRIFLFVFMVLAIFPHVVVAEGKDAFRSTDYPLPRFVSLRADKVFVRAGPGKRFPVRWEYHKQGLPVEIVLEFDVWRKIRDFEGQEGWVHKSLLSGKRTTLIQGNGPVPVYQKPVDGARLIARLEPHVVADINECQPEWCKLEASGYKGWVKREFMWGIYEKEVLE